LRIERCDTCAQYTDDQAVLKAYEDGGPIAAVRPNRQKLPVFTVVLLYPRHATGDFGADIYVEWAVAKNPFKAVKKVQQMAAASNGLVIGKEDFRPILVLTGECKVVADATSFEGGK
jgi:hypothetical protein